IQPTPAAKAPATIQPTPAAKAQATAPPAPAAKAPASVQPSPAAKAASAPAPAPAKPQAASPPPTTPVVPGGPIIEFTCPWCDNQVRVGAGREGRQPRCPECARIIKVPLKVKAKAKDWRAIDTNLPSAARRDTEPTPEGAWGTGTAASSVSKQALVEAGAIEE